jgi:hypothetical protein
LPNICENTLTLRVEYAEFNKIDTLLDNLAEHDCPDTTTFFGYFVPETYLSRDCEIKDGQMPEWYQWRVENWGTKWDAHIINYNWTELEDAWELEIDFDTAWGPPDEMYRTFTIQGRTFNATWHEPGMGFVGETDDNGVSDWEYIHWSVDDVNKYIPENLVERYALVDIVSYMEAEEAVA